ncbi:MAG: alpha/beta hydrolase [Elusimicrobiota bacterium]|jgi:acetyl esterase/lipase|nr:alpha/beta hydrolase [Elusimicrobiota bacterium]
MSGILYKIAERAVPFFVGAKAFSLGDSALEAFLKERNGRQKFTAPNFIERNFAARCETISNCPVWIIEPKNYDKASAAQKKQQGHSSAVFFLHGGGFIFGMHSIHWRAISKIIKSLQIPVWAPLYPLFPQVSIEQASLSIVDIYKSMREKIEGKITVLGDSAGAHLALVLCLHICCKEIATKLPDKIILLSPGSLNEQNPEIIAAMKEAQKRDKILSYTFIKSLSDLCAKDKASDGYFYSPFYADFKNCARNYIFPKTYILSGTYDAFFPQVEPFVKKLQGAGIDCSFERGEGMMHIWAYLPFVPECVKAFKKIIDFIS